MKDLYFIRTWLFIGLLQVVTIFYLCLREIHEKLPAVPSIDKIIHFICYFILSYYFCLVFKKQNSFKALFPLIFMGIIIEYLQRATGYRSFEYIDMVANTIGVLAGYLFSKFIYDDLIVLFEKKVLRV